MPRRRGRRRRALHRREILIAATREARAILCKAEEVNFLSGPGRGVILIKLTSPEDRVLGFVASVGDRDLLTVETSRGAEQTISTAKYEVTGRGGKGRELLQRGQFTRVVVYRRRSQFDDAPQGFGESRINASYSAAPGSGNQTSPP
jgi:DNA gyrase/topoisomerase IV subunit A